MELALTGLRVLISRVVDASARFHGAVVHPNGGRVPVSTENLLLRECVLKNTDFVEGIVIYAGHETKALLNNGGPRYKVNIRLFKGDIRDVRKKAKCFLL